MISSALHGILNALLRLQSVLSLPVCLLPVFRMGNHPTEERQYFIFGQGTLKGQKLYCARANLTACEVVSVYNALIYFGRRYPFEIIKRRFFNRGALTLFFLGLFGGNPYSIGRVLKSFHMDHKAVSPEKMAEDGAYIISFWNGKSDPSLHTVFCVRDGGRFLGYNIHSNDRSPRLFDPEKYGGLFIRIYYLGKRGTNQVGGL